MEMALALARDINTMNVGVDETLRTAHLESLPLVTGAA